MNPWSLFTSLVFSVIGCAYFIYGKKQADLVFLITGLLLMLFPYFVSNLTALTLLGVVITAAPFIGRRLALF